MNDPRSSISIFLVVEDRGFYTDPADQYIPADELNSGCHSAVRFAETSLEKAKEKLHKLAEFDAEDWGVEVKEATYRNRGQMIKGYFVLGSFYYIQEVELNEP